MILDPRKQQKKAEKRNRQQAERAREQQKRKAALSVDSLVQQAGKGPIIDCRIHNRVEKVELVVVLIARKTLAGNVVAVLFLVDADCLGVKNVAISQLSVSDYNLRYLPETISKFGLTPERPEYARKLVENVVDWSKSLGFAPHAEYNIAKNIFGDIDPSLCTEEFVFGQNGKPLFVSNPENSREFCRAVINTLTERVGSDGFNFIVMNHQL